MGYITVRYGPNNELTAAEAELFADDQEVLLDGIRNVDMTVGESYDRLVGWCRALDLVAYLQGQASSLDQFELMLAAVLASTRNSHAVQAAVRLEAREDSHELHDRDSLHD